MRRVANTANGNPIGEVCMNTTSQLSGAIDSILDHPTSGVVGMVDDLLRLCPEHGLQLDWQAGCCRIRSLGNGSDTVVDRPLRKSVFRAILARIAALCNQRSPDSVAPYGGQGELSVGASPVTRVGVSFVNTANEQWVRLWPLTEHSEADLGK